MKFLVPPESSEPVNYRRLEAVERDRHRRFALALGSLVVAVAVVFLVPARRPAWTEEAALRFGVQGPTQVVAEIRLRRPEDALASTPGGRMAMEAVELPNQSSRSDERTRNWTAPAPGEDRPPRFTVDEAPGGVLRRADVPVVQSEDLVIRTLVRPEYPHEARVQGLEAVVEAVAFVDEKGRVRSVEIVSNTGDEMFAQSAREAVRRCHFQPYKQNGRLSAVYARFRFNFKLL